jgi:hypothetical protein
MTDCASLFSSSNLVGAALQRAVEDRFPDGECERVSVSRFSPGPVADDEALERLVFHPIHIDPATGRPTSQTFADAWSSDLSVFRQERATREEIALATAQMKARGLRKTPPEVREVHGSMVARTGAIRAFLVPATDARAFRVYDTAEEEKPHHVSVFLTCFGRANMSPKAVKKRLYELFGGGLKAVTEAVS